MTRIAAETGHWAELLELAEAAETTLSLTRRIEEWIEIVERPLHAAQAVGDRQAAVRAEQELDRLRRTTLPTRLSGAQSLASRGATTALRQSFSGVPLVTWLAAGAALILAVGGGIAAGRASATKGPPGPEGLPVRQAQQVPAEPVDRLDRLELLPRRGIPGHGGPGGATGAAGQQAGAPAVRLWAIIGAGGGVVVSAPGSDKPDATLTSKDGAYDITFSEDISTCAWLAVPVRDEIVLDRREHPPAANVGLCHRSRTRSR